MAQILIRDLDDETVKRLKDRARRQGRSLEAESRQILSRAAGIGFKDARKLAQAWHERLAGRPLPESTKLIRQDRKR
jgi:plasmid stability protein